MILYMRTHRTGGQRLALAGAAVAAVLAVWWLAEDESTLANDGAAAGQVVEGAAAPRGMPALPSAPSTAAPIAAPSVAPAEVAPRPSTLSTPAPAAVDATGAQAPRKLPPPSKRTSDEFEPEN